MTLLPENPAPISSVGMEGEGGGDVEHTVAVLDPWVQEMRYCERCGGWEICIFAWECAEGRIGCCLGCGRPRAEAFTRMNSEAA